MDEQINQQQNQPAPIVPPIEPTQPVQKEKSSKAKYLIIAFIVFFIVAGSAGASYFYWDKISGYIPFLNKQEQPVACTLEAKECPDGSYVSRITPNCEFAGCPEVKCVQEEEYVDHPSKDSFECCDGLVKESALPVDENCEPIIPEGSPGIEPGWTCINCGDSICKGKYENKCNCPEDCGPSGCTDECGDGECDYTLCKKLPCPCLETEENCPEDCEESVSTGCCTLECKKYRFSDCPDSCAKKCVGSCPVCADCDGEGSCYCSEDCEGLDRCISTPDTGPCKALFIKYYFDQDEGKCKQFNWGGCEGVVPYETLEECQIDCEEGINSDNFTIVDELTEEEDMAIPDLIDVDSDLDGLTNEEEAQYGTDPNNPDSDGDGFLDGDEVDAGYNPLGEGKLEEITEDENCENIQADHEADKVRLRIACYLKLGDIDNALQGFQPDEKRERILRFMNETERIQFAHEIENAQLIFKSDEMRMYKHSWIDEEDEEDFIEFVMAKDLENKWIISSW